MKFGEFIARLRAAILGEISEGQELRALIGQLRSEIEKLKAALADSQYDASEFDALLSEIEAINPTSVADELILYVEEEPKIVTPADVAAINGNISPEYIPSESVGDSAVTAIASLLESETFAPAGEAPVPEAFGSGVAVPSLPDGEDPIEDEETDEDELETLQ